MTEPSAAKPRHWWPPKRRLCPTCGKEIKAASTDVIDLGDLPAFGTQFRFTWRTLRDWWVNRG